MFPDGQGDCSSYCVPIRRATQILTESKNSDNQFKQTIFPTKMPDCCLTLLLVVAPLAVGGFRGGHGKANLLLGAVRALCINTASTVHGTQTLSSTSSSLATATDRRH